MIDTVACVLCGLAMGYFAYGHITQPGTAMQKNGRYLGVAIVQLIL